MVKTTERRWKEKFILKNSLVKAGLSEFLGTFILIMQRPQNGDRCILWCVGSLGSLLWALGCGSVAQAVLSRGAWGGIQTISIGFAMAVTIGIYVSGGVSGGHINPAVTFAMCLTGKMKWIKFPIYVLAQFLGAFVGAAAVFGINYDAIMFYGDGKLSITGPNATAHIFATYPASFLSVTNGFADQVMSTAILLLGVFAIFDTNNIGMPKGLEPIGVGLLIILLTSSLAMNSGCAMNPARDLSPRLFTFMAGWGAEVFTAGNHWWWVPVLGPMVGGALGAGIYIIFIELHHTQPQSSHNNVKCEKYELTNMEE